jgi:hypothetical protein
MKAAKKASFCPHSAPILYFVLVQDCWLMVLDTLHKKSELLGI